MLRSIIESYIHANITYNGLKGQNIIAQAARPGKNEYDKWGPVRSAFKNINKCRPYRTLFIFCFHPGLASLDLGYDIYGL
jgi:hypothetical protein